MILKTYTAKLIWSSRLYVHQLKQNLSLIKGKTILIELSLILSLTLGTCIRPKHAYLLTYAYRLTFATTMLCNRHTI